MRKAFSPAFVATTVLGIASCTPVPTSNPPATASPPAASGEATAQKKSGVHPRDADDHLVFRRANGTCYVQVPKAGPPPKDLMSGERWVEDKELPCPKEFDDKAFAAIPDGMYWIRDESTGACSQASEFGNPPPPPVAKPCPPILEKKK